MLDDVLRVCLVTPIPPPYGGIGNWTLMVRRQAAKCPEVHIEIVNTAPPWRAVDEAPASRWRRLWDKGGQAARDFLQSLRQLRKRPHVVHLNTSGQFAILRDLSVLALARCFRVPVVYHLRFGRVPQLAEEGTTREWRLLARAMRRAHTVIAVDGKTEQAIRRYLPDVRVVRIPNCIDVSALPTAALRPCDVNAVMFLGWVIPTKGMEELVAAWAVLRPERWRLCIVGPGNPAYQQELIEKYQPVGIEFLGEKTHDEAMRLMAEAEVFVLPSHTEGFPNVIAEAMALKKSIVATRVGAIPEMLADDCGVLIDSQDMLGLRDALAQVLADVALRRRLGANAHARVVGNYSLEVVFAQYLTLWRQVAEQG